MERSKGLRHMGYSHVPKSNKDSQTSWLVTTSSSAAKTILSGLFGPKNTGRSQESVHGW
jgi:hypothetical protein